MHIIRQTNSLLSSAHIYILFIFGDIRLNYAAILCTAQYVHQHPAKEIHQSEELGISSKKLGSKLINQH